MKKMYLYLVTALTISSLVSSIKAMEIANPPVFLVNNYESQAQVYYMLGNSNVMTIGYGAKIALEKTIRDIKNVRLFISTSGYPGTWTDISNELQKIGIPMDGRYYDAIITINSSEGILGSWDPRASAWNITVSTEPRGEKIKMDWPASKTLPTTRALPVKKQTVK